MRNHTRKCEEIICLETHDDIIEDVVQEPLKELNFHRQDPVPSSSLQGNKETYEKMGQNIANTWNPDNNVGSNVVDEIDLHCLSENIPSTSTCTKITAKKKKLKKLKLKIRLKKQELKRQKELSKQSQVDIEEERGKN